MRYLTLDFETYYDKDYSLSKKGMTTQDYIMSPKFAVLMASVKWGDGETQVVEAPDLPAFFASVDWAQTAVVNHNSVFDLSILWWRYGYRPALAVDTMSLAQCLGVPLLTGSASLAKCVQLLQEAGYELPSKGGEVVNALGKHRKDFTPAQWEAYKQYCKTDADITWFLFKVLKQYVSDDELAYQDIILRCYTEPRLKVHVPTVEYELARCRAYKAGQLAKVCEQLGCTQDNLAGVLRSNDKFAALLKAMSGITEAEMEQGAQGSFIIPTKVSATTGKVTWAFGKTDVGFKELCENELPFVQAICQARLAAKSSIDETRCEKFLDYASYGFLPMGYKIGGAHTNRMSGGSAGSANMQNLPSGRREGQSDLLRRSIIANDGQVIVNYDASQIECRVLNYIANQTDVLGVFASKGDVYSYTAAGVYGIPYSEINEGRKSSNPEIAAKYKPIRNYGKTCALALGYGQGAAGFQKYALVNSGINMSLDEAKRTVTAWRKANYAAAGFWKTCDQALQVMVDGGQMYFGGQDGKMFFADGKRFLLGRHVPGIQMPNGLWLNYPNLHVDMSSGKPQFVYDKMGYTGKPLKSKAYGGLICENIVQSLAFAIMKQQALWIAKYYPIVMNTHDEWCVVVPRDQAETAAEYMARCMRTAPDYVAGLPLDTEGGWAQSYGAVDDDWSKRPDNPDRVHRFDPNTGDIL
jgi:DNA-directed DNA polymerase